ncbi:hypothetical protein JKF63_00102 [Porcisia hertigi]|uniref:Uncharacterized protein n=1 Tax=Porcisia hertigi TaxID=2761500 RepID=A0A836L6I0_9TRYP|nr:hypothetical protein JKF63_00102 [Porcisia hertigi]
MPPSSQRSEEEGGRRVVHVGNAVLSVVVFVVALVSSMAILDPDRSGELLSARRRTPPMDYTENVFMEGYTPVVVQVHKRNVLVVPAAGSQGVSDVSRALDVFFSRGLGFVSGTGCAVTKGADMQSQVITLSDVHSALLLDRADPNATNTPPVADWGDATVSRSARYPSVLHLCSATSCMTPYVTQQWSDRAVAAASLLANKSAPRAPPLGVRAGPVDSFALVFGESSEALAVMQDLAEQRVSIPQKPLRRTGQLSVAPLVGKLAYGDLEASCNTSKQCSYRSPVKHAQLSALLEVVAARLPTAASKKRVFKEWLRRNASYLGAQAWASVDVLPFNSVVFTGSQAALHTFPVDLVYVDVDSRDSAATLAYLTALASDTDSHVRLHPRNLLVSIFPSEWMNNIVNALTLLEEKQRYCSIPLYKSCMANQADFAPSKRWRISHTNSWMGKDGLEGTYLSPFLERSRAAQIPVCTVLLSRQVGTLEELIQMASKVIRSYPPDASPMERFLYYSLGLSPEDEEVLTRLPATATDARGSVVSSSLGDLSGMMDYVAQYAGFAVPLVVGLVLTWSVCRRRGRSGRGSQ